MKHADDGLDTDTRQDLAIEYIPAILSQLDADGCEMLATVLQAYLERGASIGYDDGLSDGTKHSPGFPERDQFLAMAYFERLVNILDPSNGHRDARNCDAALSVVNEAIRKLKKSEEQN